MSLNASVGSTRRRRAVAAATGLAVVLLTAACGEDDAAPASNLEGDPIVVMTEAPIDTQAAPYPQIGATAELYEQYINDNGGIQGRPLQVIVCDDRNDPAEAAKCAREAAEEDVVAFVGSFTTDASRAIPILEDEKIAWFGGCCPVAALESSSEVAFPLAFSTGFYTAIAIKMANDGCEKPVSVWTDVPALETRQLAFANGWKSAGRDPSELINVSVPIEAGDYSSHAARVATEEPDCMWGFLSDSQWPSMITAMDGVGSSPRYYGTQGSLSSVVVEQFPEQTDGAFYAAAYPDLSSEALDDFQASIEKYDAEDLDYNSLAALGTWTGFVAFTNVVEGMTGAINNETFLEAASTTSELDTDGILAPVDLTEEWTGGGGLFPRVFNRNIVIGTIQDGKIVPLDETPIDVSEAFDGNPS